MIEAWTARRALSESEISTGWRKGQGSEEIDIRLFLWGYTPWHVSLEPQDVAGSKAVRFPEES